MGDLARLIYFRQEKDLLIRVGLSILVERFFDLIGPRLAGRRFSLDFSPPGGA